MPEPPPPLPVAPPGSKDRSTWAYVAGVVVLAVVLIGGVLVLTRESDEAPGTAAGEVFLEPADAPGAHPFTEDLDTNTAPAPVRLLSATPGATTTPNATASPTSSVAVRSVEGSAPGLYGGTQDGSACDAERLVGFLGSEPEKAAAWAAVQGIVPDAIPGFVAGLTPLVLRTDTRVTNHGYRDGRATPFQSVLEAGTAVLVDDLGIPRVKCGCGNPLVPPVAQAGGVRYTGTRWPGFRPGNVVVIVNTVNVRITKFVVVNLVRPGFFTRPIGATGSPPADGAILIDEFCDLFPEDCRPPELVAGGAAPSPRPGEPVLGTGDVQITLRWSSTADLDLAVVDPNGERIDFSAPTSSSGGQLDVDSNAGCNDPTSTPVENVFWPTGQSPDGDYTIIVTYYAECSGGSGPQTFELSALIGGVPVAVTTVSLAGELRSRFTLLPWEEQEAEAFETLAETATVDPGGQFTGTVSTSGGSLAGLVPHAPQPPTAIGIDPASLTIDWLPSFDEDSGIEESYEITLEPGGTTFVVAADMLHLTIPGLEPGVEYTISVVAVNAAGASPPSTVTGTPWGDPSAVVGDPVPAPGPETLEEYCDRLYPPPPTIPAENPMWTLCMHDPASGDAVDPGDLPLPVAADGD